LPLKENRLARSAPTRQALPPRRRSFPKELKVFSEAQVKCGIYS